MTNHVSRRSFIGGSDARIIMGDDEAALLRLWREKRGEAEPEDLSANLIVQLGLVTEPLNRIVRAQYRPGMSNSMRTVPICVFWLHEVSGGARPALPHSRR
jgi:predicted phage-related endonuclease